MFERGEQCVNQSAMKSYFTPKSRQADVLLNSAGKPTNKRDKSRCMAYKGEEFYKKLIKKNVKTQYMKLSNSYFKSLNAGKFVPTQLKLSSNSFIT